MYGDYPYRVCPVCGRRLPPCVNYKDKNGSWEQYNCKNNCTTEVHIMPFKGIREKYQKKRKKFLF